MLKKTTVIASVILLVIGYLYADNFTKEDVRRWQQEFDAAAQYGRQLWVNSATFKLGTNKVACAQCHPNAANTHPETYPKFQKQLGRVINIGEMVNWCIINPLEGKPLKLDSKEMNALLAYMYWERRGVKLAPGKH
jgi:cytochrome c